MPEPEPTAAAIDRHELTVATFREADAADRAFWLSRTPVERLRHLEALRELNYGSEVINQGLQRVLAVSQRSGR